MRQKHAAKPLSPDMKRIVDFPSGVFNWKNYWFFRFPQGDS
jgi:hypothetical protein